MKKLIKRLILAAVVLGGIGGGAWWYLTRDGKSDVRFRTAQVNRGDLLVTISATGTLEPEEVVDVGAQVAGQILEFGPDALTPRSPAKDTLWKKARQEKEQAAAMPTNTPSTEASPSAMAAAQPKSEIDYGSIVNVGTLLAKIDDSTYRADLQAAEADKESAQAEVASAEAAQRSAEAAVDKANADLKQMEAKRYQAEKDWLRAQAMGSSEALAKTQYDAYEAAFKVAQASVEVGKAAIAQAQRNAEQAGAAINRTKAAVKRADATLTRVRRNLGYCTIVSPVKGVIIDRRVNIGQTVVASLNAPSLFLIAKDLKRMEIWVPVNEADIASIYEGQPATFTVDAFPGETFRGQVEKIRKNATMTQNVVTYTVEVATDNSDERLLPYLTANVQFELARREGAMLVVNSALRWTPRTELVAPDARDSYARSQASSGRDGRKKGERGTTASAPADGAATRAGKPAGRAMAGAGRAAVLWVKDGQFVRPVKVRAGLSDGAVTEVTGPEVKEGLEVVTGEEQQGAAGEVGRSPFAPPVRPPRSGTGGSSGGTGGGRSGGGR